MSRERILLTPSLAKELLSHNYVGNRRTRPSIIAKYAIEIKEGRWNSEVSNIQDPLMISKDGELLNGQHRCHAVIEADTPIYIYVEKDVDVNIFKYLDDGEKRAAADYISLPNANGIACLAKIICAVEDGSAPLTSAILGKMNNGKVLPMATRQQILDKVHTDSDRIVEYFRLGMRAAVYLGGNGKRGPISAAFFIIDFCGRGDMLDRFADECSKLVPSSHAIIVLRSYVAKCLGQSNFKADYKWMCGCIFTAYEAFRGNIEIKSFNKIGLYFSQYDKYVGETRNNMKEK